MNHMERKVALLLSFLSISFLKEALDARLLTVDHYVSSQTSPLLAIIAFDSQLQCFTYLHWGPGPRCTQGELDVPYELCLIVWAEKSIDVLRKLVTFKTQPRSFQVSRCEDYKDEVCSLKYEEECKDYREKQ